MGQSVLYLGIDGGGTSCRARVVDENGALIGEGRGGSSNTNLGIDRSYGEIVKATLEALAQGGLGESDMRRIHAGFGIAGLHFERDKARVRAFDHPFASVTADNDAYTACLGAHQGEDGAIAIFGTGSSGVAIVGDEVFNVGGWGFRVSDQGCGAITGREAVRRALQAHEKILEPSDFSRAVMARFDHAAENVAIWAETAEPADFGTFAPLVVEHANNGDALATRIMKWSAEDATDLLRALVTSGANRICLMGGFSKYLVPWLGEDVKALLVEARGDAQDGAIRMARRAARTAAA